MANIAPKEVKPFPTKQLAVTIYDKRQLNEPSVFVLETRVLYVATEEVYFSFSHTDYEKGEEIITAMKKLLNQYTKP